MSNDPYNSYNPQSNNPYPQSNPYSSSPYQSSDPYTPSPSNPPMYQPTDPYATPTAPTDYIPPQQPARKNRHMFAIISLCVILVALIGIGAAIFINQQPSAPALPSYPSLSHGYGGTVHNTTVNQTANMAMTSITQTTNQISGSIQFGLPLIGSGSFTGTVTRQNTIQFTVTTSDAGVSTINFKGTIAHSGSLSGSYTVDNGQKGTWQATSATAPVAYPLLNHNYTGTFHNNKTKKDGPATMAIVTQHQQNFNGTFDSTAAINGSVGENNTIQFTTTDTQGNTFTFNGTVNIDQSLSGSYTVNNSATGTWILSPTQ